MAIKTFTTGEVLTASDTNTYLANSGLVYVNSTTLSGASTNLASCFNATYDNYRVVIGNLDLSSTTTRPLSIQFSNGGTPVATGYEWWAQFVYTGGGGVEGNASATSWQITQFSGDTTPSGSLWIEIGNPFNASYTTGTNQAFAYQSGAGGYVNRIGGGVLKNNTSYSGLTVLTSGDSLSGTITVYGYRKA
jgi:hypothetical protein